MNGIEFLNSVVYCSSANLLQTKPYSMPSDEHTYLQSPSFAIPPIILGIYLIVLFTQFIGQHRKNMITKLAKASSLIFLRQEAIVLRSFRKRLINSKPKTGCHTWSQILKLTSGHKKQVFPLVSDFNPALSNIGAILNTHILNLDRGLIKVITPIIYLTRIVVPKLLEIF